MKKSELVFIRGEYKTDVTEVQFNPEKQKYLVDFGNGKKYPYKKENCAIVAGEIVEVTDDSVVYVENTKLETYDSIYKFTFDEEDYFKVNFGDECTIYTKKDFCSYQMNKIRKVLEKNRIKAVVYAKITYFLNKINLNFLEECRVC